MSKSNVLSKKDCRDILHAAYMANRLPGNDKVWLILIAPPDCGISSVAGLAEFTDSHLWSPLTEGALLNNAGGVLTRVGETGTLLIEDMSPALGTSIPARSLQAALWDIRDGSFRRVTGTGGGREFNWSGRVGVIAAAPERPALYAFIRDHQWFFFTCSVKPPMPVTTIFAVASKASASAPKANAKLKLSKSDTSMLEGTISHLYNLYYQHGHYQHGLLLPAQLTRHAASLLLGMKQIGLSADRRRELIHKVLLGTIEAIHTSKLLGTVEAVH